MARTATAAKAETPASKQTAEKAPQAPSKPAAGGKAPAAPKKAAAGEKPMAGGRTAQWRSLRRCQVWPD